MGGYIFPRAANCKRCHKEFTKRGDNHEFCTEECSRKSRLRPQSPGGQSVACSQCGEIFTKVTYNHKFCSKECEKSKYKIQRYQGLLTGTVGAIGEALVCADLMARGVHVFRSMSPACPCDLVAMFEGRLYRVEVTKGMVNYTGGYSWAKHDEAKYDVLALYLLDGKIVYLPGVFPEIRRLLVVEPGIIPDP